MSLDGLITEAFKFVELHGVDNVRGLCKDYGVVIEEFEIEGSSLYATVYDDCILLNTSVINERDLSFIIAHELAHKILHHDVYGKALYFSDVKSRGKEEKEANVFATIFTGRVYEELYDSKVQKVINYIYLNYLMNNEKYRKKVYKIQEDYIY